MSKRIAITCPDHLYKVLSGLSAFQQVPMSRVIVELLEEAYPALLTVHDSLNEIRLQGMAADSVRLEAYNRVMDNMASTLDDMVSGMKTEFDNVRQPPHSNTGATISQVTDIKRNTPKPGKAKK